MAAFFHPKARQWVHGRQGLFEKLKDQVQRWQTNKPPAIIWMHCASLGEFEQGRPLLEKIRKQAPQSKILLTFFSPSGYEIRKNYIQADYVCYLPKDTNANAIRFLHIVQPTLIIFVKYEFWYHFLLTAKSAQVPTLLISATFRAEQPFFQWYGDLHRQMLACFEYLFVQENQSKSLLQTVGYQNVSVVGDTRIDRVLTIASQAPDFPEVAAFCSKHKVLVIGSSWQQDEAILIPFINQYLPSEWKCIIAPHDIKSANLKRIETVLKISSIRYSELSLKKGELAKVLLIDNIGMLSTLYRYGQIAYIGGGFGSGIHNILEPAAHGLPIIFGLKFQKFEEAKALIKKGGAFSINHHLAFQAIFSKLMDEEFYQKAQKAVQSYLSENQGATKKILSYLKDREFGKTNKNN